MEELLRGFSLHLTANISQELGYEVEDYINKVFNNTYSDNILTEDYDEIEHEIKNIIANYFKRCEMKQFYSISQNLYNGYVDADDKNIFKAVKLFISIYSKFEEVKFRRLFTQWRINILYVQKKNKINKDVMPQSIGTFKKKEENKKKNYEHKSKTTNQSSNAVNSMKDYNSYNISGIISPISSTNSNKSKPPKVDVFNKLYMNSIKKNDERLLNDEIKKLSEMDECTFRPKIRNMSNTNKY